jgi:hypothetical protein
MITSVAFVVVTEPVLMLVPYLLAVIAAGVEGTSIGEEVSTPVTTAISQSPDVYVPGNVTANDVVPVATPENIQSPSLPNCGPEVRA